MALTESLISHWKLDEASGTRDDAHGTNDLTDNNTVGSATGKLGNAADFVSANSESLSIADNASLSAGDIDFTFACWVKFTSLGAYMALGCKDEGGGGQREWILYYDNGGDFGTPQRLGFGVSSNGSAFAGLDATTFGALSTATWYFVVCWHDSVNNQLGIQVNNGTADTASHSAGVFDSTAAFRLGAFGGGIFLNGLIDSASFWKRVLTSDERTQLYNGGAGLDYESFAGTVTGSLTATLGALAVSSTGTVAVAGSLTATLGALTVSSTGTVAVAGSLASTLDALTLSSTGTVAIAGSAALTLGTVTISAAGTVAVAGAATVTLGALTLSATGTVVTGGPTFTGLAALIQNDLALFDAVGDLDIASDLAIFD